MDHSSYSIIYTAILFVGKLHVITQIVHIFTDKNCVNSSVHACEYGCDTPYEELVVSIEEVTHAIEKLDLNKACGSDGICSEHLKYSSNILVPLLAMCFTSFFSHGFLPETMLSVMLVPVIKDKAGKISSKDNYRPIA